MAKLIYSLFLLLAMQFGNAQQTINARPPSISKIYLSSEVTVKPQFNGGTSKLNSFLKKNFKKPKGGLKGEVQVSFIVEVDGSLSEIGILSDIGKGTGEEAIRVMTLSPKWIAGKLNGIPVRTQYLLPIKI
jgi:Gram-negative bacterial TonB protein C-terminal